MDSENQKAYQIIEVKDVSHANAKRYNCEVLIQEGLSKEQIKEIVVEITENLKDCNIFRNDIFRKIHTGKKSQCIWLCIEDVMGTLCMFERDTVGKINDPVWHEWICLSLWIDPTLPDEYRPMCLGGDDKIRDIEIMWCDK